MLYDVLHVTEGWGPLQAVEISITLLYCIDFFYLQSDLGSDQLPQGNWRDTMLDAAIAVVFGAAYWQASDRKLFTCYALLAVAGALIVGYHFTPNRRFLWAILPHSVLTVLFVSLAWLARGLENVTWTFAVVSWFPTIWYGTYVFWLANRMLPSGKLPCRTSCNITPALGRLKKRRFAPSRYNESRTAPGFGAMEG